MQLLAFSQEILCEAKVTVNPLRHTTAGTILIIVSLIDILLAMLSRIEPRWQGYLAS